MTELWQIAISVTGVSGVAAFVLFSLYKEWLRVPALESLTKAQKFKLLRLFLVLTFLFACSAFGLSAYQKHLDSSSISTSAKELETNISFRYDYGRRKLSNMLKMNVWSPIEPEPEQQDIIREIYEQYVLLTKEALDAIKNGQLNVFHEKNHKLQELLRSEKARKYIPGDDVIDMCFQPPEYDDINIPHDPTIIKVQS